MNTTIRIESIRLENFKNVKNGEISLKLNNGFLNTLNVLGIYGQNGSGKTAVVDAFSVIKNLVSKKTLNEDIKQYMSFNEKISSININLKMINSEKEYAIKYYVGLEKKEDNVIINFEKLEYRPIEPKKKFSTIIDYNINNEDCVFSPVKIFNKLIKTQNDYIDIENIKAMCIKNRNSFIFNDGFFDMLEKNNNLKEEKVLISSVYNYFKNDFEVVDCGYFKNVTNGSFYGKFKFLEETFIFDDHIVIKKAFKKDLDNALNHINSVLKTVINGLILETEIFENNETEIKIGFFACRDGVKVPLTYESEGIKKIISILSLLIYVYNNESACLVIDDLDSFMFEYLLGELLNIINEKCKGQIIFTSHNLRPLEVLNAKSIVFTTTNENNKYIKFKNIKYKNNLRDIYYQTIKSGGQVESVYKETASKEIRCAFSKAFDLYK